MRVHKESGRNYLRFGVMCFGDKFQAWQAQAIRELLSHGHKCELLIVDGNHREKLSILRKLLKYPYNQLVYRQYTNHFFRPGAKKMIPLNNELSGMPVIHCQTICKTYSQFFLPSDIQIIKAYKLDFILRFGFNILRGEILEAAKYGIWSYHHDDEQKYRGGPPGFWELYFNDPVNGAILQRLTDKLDAGIILKKGYFKTLNYSYSAHADRLFFETAKWPLQVVNDIICSDPGNKYWKESTSRANIYHNPDNWAMLVFFCKMFRNKMKFYRENLFKAEKWNIAITRMFRSDLLDENNTGIKAEFLPSPTKHTYLADPFSFMRNGRLEILCEEFNYKLSKGIISRLIYDPFTRSVTAIKPAIQEDWHLAYPYIFEYKGDVYCLPESANKLKVNLYKLDNETDHFTLYKSILENVDAVDPTLFQYNGLWWLFYTRKHLSDTHLYACYSSDPFEGYQFHYNNPIKTDVQSARPAGVPFILNGELYRPAQDCSRTYGGNIAIMRINRLDPYHFEEEFIKNIDYSTDPGSRSRKSYYHGLHTLNQSGDYLVVDGKRYVFDSYHFRRKLQYKLRKIVNM
jgi:hypothetical protein